jgi:hypothetical protein
MKSLSPAVMRAQSTNTIHLAVEFNVSRLTPRSVRRRFAGALRSAIARVHLSGTADQAVCEELWRLVPDPEGI